MSPGSRSRGLIPLAISAATLLVWGCEDGETAPATEDAGEREAGAESSGADAGALTEGLCLGVDGKPCPDSHPCTDEGVCDCGVSDADGDGDDSPACSRDGHDCDDSLKAIYSGAEETCNYVDDNCNGMIDDAVKDGEVVEYGLQFTLYPDQDADTHVAKADSVQACEKSASEQGSRTDIPAESRLRAFHVYVDPPPKDDEFDDDDTDPRIYPGAPELCDGVDNNQDGRVEQEGDELSLPEAIQFNSVEVSCDFDAHRIKLECLDPDWTWCPDRKICEAGEDWCSAKWAQGCDVDATRLNSCRGCDTDCKHRCGDGGCDEVVEVVSGRYHTCVRSQEGNVACFGRGSHGQLGAGFPVGLTHVPLAVYGLTDARLVAAGGNNGCAAVGEDRRLYCWGDDTNRQLGADDRPPTGFAPTPIAVVPNRATGTAVMQGVRSVAIATSGTHGCAVLEEGQLLCWGSEAGGRLGNGYATSNLVRPTPAKYDLQTDVADAERVALGQNHGCILRNDGTVACWGSNTLSQLGLPADPLASSSYLVPLVGLTDVVAIAAGDDFTCALTSGGDGETNAVRCWGSNASGQLGYAPSAASGTPSTILDLASPTQLAAGANHACVLDGDRVRCWGASERGQLGLSPDGQPGDPVTVDVPLSPGETLVGVFALSFGGCASTSANTVYCWGAYEYGQIGRDPNAPPDEGAWLEPVAGSAL